MDLVKVTNPPGERELCRFAIIGNGDSWESIHAEIGERPDVYMPGAVVGEEKLGKNVVLVLGENSQNTTGLMGLPGRTAAYMPEPPGTNVYQSHLSCLGIGTVLPLTCFALDLRSAFRNPATVAGRICFVPVVSSPRRPCIAWGSGGRLK